MIGSMVLKASDDRDGAVTDLDHRANREPLEEATHLVGGLPPFEAVGGGHVGAGKDQAQERVFPQAMAVRPGELKRLGGAKEFEFGGGVFPG